MERIKSIIDDFKDSAVSWTAYSAFGSFLLYLVGYLVTRFELTMLGVAQNLSVLEERYFFAGARFVVYLAAAIPSLILLLLVPAAILGLIARLLPVRVAIRFTAIRPNTFYLAGIIFAVAVIQFIARQCFALNNLLLAPSLPGPSWLKAILLDDQDQVAPVFFAGLLAATALTIAFLVAGNRRSTKEKASRFLGGLLTLLLAIQVLLLPINYAVLIGQKNFARVTNVPPIAAGRAWLIWENNDAVTLFVLSGATPNDRALVTLEAKNTYATSRIVGYDPVLRILFAPPQ